MSKLNQIIAIEKGIKSRVCKEVSKMHNLIQKPELFNGMAKVYQPIDEEDIQSESLPPESKKVQLIATEVLNDLAKEKSEYYDVTARKDWTNNVAKADVVVDGEILIADAPVTYLLTLEKELVDVRTFIEHLPILDTSEDWHFDISSGLSKTKETQTHRTKKKAKAIVLHPPTKEHPAQTQLVSEDILVGYWNTVKHSGAISRKDKVQLLEKAETLVNAVKEAREAANDVEEIRAPKIGQTIFGYLFGSEQI